MIEVAIRDDDVNYFTRVAELQDAYANLPSSIPISFGVVPFHGCSDSPAVPEDFPDPEKEYPIGHNNELIEFLYDGLTTGDFSILQHGYSHTRNQGNPEFASNGDLRPRLRKGRKYLEELFDCNIDVFVPPNNSFSRSGLRAVKAEGMKTLYYPTPLSRPKTPRVVRMTLGDLWFKYKALGEGPVKFVRRANSFWRLHNREVFMPIRPKPYRVQGSQEFTCMTLTRDDDLSNVKKQLDLTAEHDGKFCLAIHYHSFRSDDFTDRFYRFIELADSKYESAFVRVEDLFKENG